MTVLSFRQAAPKDSRFAPGSFDSWTGRHVPVKVMGCWVADCLIMSAELAEDGSAVNLTMDLPDEAAPQAPIPGGSLRSAEGDRR